MDKHNANVAWEQILAIVSHDIKNPLNAIQLEAQMLLRIVDRHGKSLLGEEVKIQANRILKTTERLKVLINDLLEKNKSENCLTLLNREEVEVARLVQDVIDSTRPLVRQKNLMVRSLFPSGLRVYLDRNKMFQVLSNLITNAIKFTPHGGALTISIEECVHELIFKVSDSGPGLRTEDLLNVFEKYWTGVTDCSGTGLGLFICKTIVEAHGGRIMAENLSDGGAVFSFTVPRMNVSSVRALSGASIGASRHSSHAPASFQPKDRQ